MSANGVTNEVPTYSWSRANGAVRQKTQQEEFQEAAAAAQGKDTVEISDLARAMASGMSIDLAAMSEEDKKVTVIRKEFDTEQLAALKKKFSSLKTDKADIDSHIRAVLKAKGIKYGTGDKMKIEIDDEGKAVVGGIKDAKTARAIEEAINNEKGLAEKIDKYQSAEREVSRDLKKATGQNLADFKAYVESYQKNWYSSISRKEDGTFCTPAEMANLEGHDLFFADPELTDMIREHIGNASGLDISADSKILVNPENSMENDVQSIMREIDLEFKEHNRRLMEMAEEMGLTPEEVEERKLSVAGVKVTVSTDGTVVIEGATAKDKDADQGGKNIIESVFARSIQTNPVTQEQDPFATTADHILRLYEEEFSEDKHNEREVKVVWEKGMADTFVASPKREAELVEGINEAVGVMMKERGVDIDGLDLEFDIDKNSKILLVNPPEDEMLAKQVEAALESINITLEGTEAATPEEMEGESLGNTAQRLKSMTKELTTIRPWGKSELTGAKEMLDTEATETEYTAAAPALFGTDE